MHAIEVSLWLIVVQRRFRAGHREAFPDLLTDLMPSTLLFLRRLQSITVESEKAGKFSYQLQCPGSDRREGLQRVIITGAEGQEVETQEPWVWARWVVCSNIASPTSAQTEMPFSLPKTVDHQVDRVFLWRIWKDILEIGMEEVSRRMRVYNPLIDPESSWSLVD